MKLQSNQLKLHIFGKEEVMYLPFQGIAPYLPGCDPHFFPQNFRVLCPYTDPSNLNYWCTRNHFTFNKILPTSGPLCLIWIST